jgi:hypothetical protein
VVAHKGEIESIILVNHTTKRGVVHLAQKRTNQFERVAKCKDAPIMEVGAGNITLDKSAPQKRTAKVPQVE